MTDSVASDKTQPRPDPDGEGGFNTSRTVAHGTMIRAIGEIVAKVASLLFFVMIARRLGDDNFGDFIFGISFGQLLMIVAALGTEELITREVSKNHEEVEVLFPNVIAVKRYMLFALWLVMAAVVLISGHDRSSATAILIVGAAVAVEYQTKTFTAVFLAFEVQKYIAMTLIIQRGLTAALGIGALLLGADLIEVSIVFFAGSLVGLTVAWVLMRGRVVSPTRHVDRTLWREILTAALPLGAIVVLYQVLIRLDAVLLSFLVGGSDRSNSELGQYGAAYRLVDATMFLSFAFTGAIYPWFSRSENGNVSVARGFSLALKAVLAILVPIGVTYSVFATDLIDTLYGPEYAGAITPLRLLGGMTILFGINAVVSIVLIALERPRDFFWPAVIVIIQNLIFNLITIPKYGANAAAANAVISGLLLAALSVARTARPLDRIDWLSVFLAPVAAALVMAGLGILAMQVMPWMVAAALALVAYLLAYAAIERAAYPGDFRFVTAVVKQVRERLWVTADQPRV